jgi:thioredoxin-dependent peroxiredoxin
MPLLLGDTAPDFTASTTEGAIKFHEWLGDSWAILFSHPADYTPVCTTELGVVAKMKGEFERRNIKVIGLSVDSLEDHHGWIADINETQHADVHFPIIADLDRNIANMYGMIHPKETNNFTVRSVFVIDPFKKIRLTFTYPASTGRNFDEILRVVDAMQLTDSFNVATPVNWSYGQDCIIPPTLTAKSEMEKAFPKGWTEHKPYLRTTPQPNI